MRLVIRVAGRPAPQGSKKRGTAGQLRESSPYLPAWRRAVVIGARRALLDAGIRPAELPLFPLGVPVLVERCVFIVTDRQCRGEATDEPIGEPDIDKLLRATLDALGGARKETARVFADDSQVTAINGLRKTRPIPGVPGYEAPGALIIIGQDRGVTGMAAYYIAVQREDEQGSVTIVNLPVTAEQVAMIVPDLLAQALGTEPADDGAGEQAKPKRTRRTKAQIEADKAAAEQASGEPVASAEPSSSAGVAEPVPTVTAGELAPFDPFAPRQ